MKTHSALPTHRARPPGWAVTTPVTAGLRVLTTRWSDSGLYPEAAGPCADGVRFHLEGRSPCRPQ